VCVAGIDHASHALGYRSQGMVHCADPVSYVLISMKKLSPKDLQVPASSKVAVSGWIIRSALETRPEKTGGEVADNTFGVYRSSRSQSTRGVVVEGRGRLDSSVSPYDVLRTGPVLASKIRWAASRAFLPLRSISTVPRVPGTPPTRSRCTNS